MSVDKVVLPAFKSYNVLSFTARKKSCGFTNFKITYSPDFRNDIALSWPSSINDDEARHDWGWQEQYDIKKMTEKMISGINSNLNVISS